MLQGAVHGTPQTARALDDMALIAALEGLARRSRAANAALVAHLSEMDARELHLRRGYSSLFVYCRDALALSEHDAYRLVGAARAARRFPIVLDMLAEGSLNLTTLRLLAPCLTAENHRQVLAAARGKRRAQVEELVAMFLPQPDVPPAMQYLLSPGAAPLSPGRYKVQLTVAADTVAKLRLAQDMLRHALPTGDEAAILERALSALLTDLARTKFAATDRPRAPRETAPGSRHVPAEVKRAVWVRDLGRCAFTGTEGRRCDERGFLEFHHVRPFAAGGEPTAANIELRCRRHNDYEARTYCGPDTAREAAGSYA